MSRDRLRPAWRAILSLIVLATAFDLVSVVRAEPVQTGIPATLSSAGQSAIDAKVAVDARGNEVVVWSRSDGSNTRIQAVRRTPWGALSSVKTLSPAGEDAVDPDVAVDAAGNAIVVWAGGDEDTPRIKLRRRSASGDLGAVTPLSAAGKYAELPEVAMDAAGNAIIMWHLFDGSDLRIQVVRRSASGDLSSIKTLSAAGRDAEEGDLAVDPDGNAVVVWKRSDGTHNRIEARRRSASGNLSAVQLLSASGQHAGRPAVAIQPTGRAYIVWRRFDGSNWRLQGRSRSASGNLSSVQDFSDAGVDATETSIQVAVDPSGNALAVWSQTGANLMVKARRRSSGGTLGAVEDVSIGTGGAGFPRVAFDATGVATVAWAQFDSVNMRVLARARSTGGTWGSIATLSEAGQDAGRVEVALDPSGNAVLTWDRWDGSNSRIQTASLVNVQNISPASENNLEALDMAVDDKGRAVLVWEMYDFTDSLIRVRRRSASGSVTAAQMASSGGQSAQDPHVAVDGKGNAVIVWVRYDGSHWRIQLRGRSASGTLGSVRTVSPSGRDAFHPQVAMDPDGNAVVVWERFDGSHWRVQAVRRSADGALSSVKTLSPSGKNSLYADVGMDGKGRAVVVWMQHDGTDFLAKLRRRSANGTLSSIQTLSAPGESVDIPQVAVDRAGHALVVWQRSDGSSVRIQARRRSASGNLGVVKTLSAAGQNASGQRVAIDRSGNAVVVWHRSDGANDRIQVQWRSAAGTWGPIQTVSGAGQDASSPEVAVDRDGRAVVVWVQYYDENYRIKAVRSSASGALSDVLNVSPAFQDAELPRVAVDRSGAATVAWIWMDGLLDPIQTARLPGG